MKFIQPNTDLYVTLTGAQNGADDSYFNAATVTAVVQTPGGTEVVSSQPLSYISASNGNYSATLNKALFASMVKGRTYVVLITANDSGSGIDREWKIVAKFDHDVDP